MVGEQTSAAGVEGTIAALIERGREEGCLELSEVSRVVESLELGDADVQAVFERIGAAAIEVSDDCARDAPEHVTYENAGLATATTDALRLFLNEIDRFQLLSAEEEVDLAQAIERGDSAAKERLINSNLRLVVSIARRFHSDELALLDRIQEGVLGLIRASEKFDWRRGLKFSTYATWWIREAISRAAQNKARTIRMPVYILERERKVVRAERQLTVTLGRAPSDDETATFAGITVAQLQELRVAGRTVTSLDKPVGEAEEGSATIGDLMPSSHGDPLEELDVSLRADALHRAVDALPDVEAEVVRLRFGLSGEDSDPCTLDETVRRLGMPRTRVRTVEARALARLAAMREVEGLE